MALWVFGLRHFLYPSTSPCPYAADSLHPVRRKSRLEKVYLAKLSEFPNHSMAKASLLKIHDPRLRMLKMTDGQINILVGKPSHQST